MNQTDLLKRMFRIETNDLTIRVEVFPNLDHFNVSQEGKPVNRCVVMYGTLEHVKEDDWTLWEGHGAGSIHFQTTDVVGMNTSATEKTPIIAVVWGTPLDLFEKIFMGKG